MRVLLILCLAALLASCATAPSNWSDGRFIPSPELALIVGSITYDGGLGRYGIGATARNGGPSFGASVGYGTWPPFGPMFDDALQKKGGTFAVPVAPGQYTLQRWSIEKGARQYIAAVPIGLPFTAKAGRVTYLGNFHFDRDGSVTLTEQAARDLRILQQRFPTIAMTSPAISIPTGARLERLGEDDAARIDAGFYAAPATTPSRSP